MAITWNVLQNEAAGSHSLFTSELILTNTGEQSLGNQGWELYFNFCRKILPETVSETVQIAHVNGDLFKLVPRSKFLPLRPGTSRTIRFQTNFAVFKASDAPSGFYLVVEDCLRQRKIVEPLGEASVRPIHNPQLTMRTRDDQVAVPTPRSRYDENLDHTNLGNPPAAGVLPTPTLLQASQGEFVIDRNTKIAYCHELQNEADYLSEVLEPLIGCQLATQNLENGLISNHAITLSIQDLTVDGRQKAAGDNAYHLSILKDEGIVITGTDPAGVFYGIQSLRAWFPIDAFQNPTEEISVGAIKIEDAPRFRYRGLHLDVARNFQQPATVKKLLDLMAFYKLNKFHFHLTDDEGWRLEIAGLPELTEFGGRRSHPEEDLQSLPPSFGSGPHANSATSYGSGFYSRQDFLDILLYAAERHIEVVPEIDLPGHSRAAIKAMEFRRKRFARCRLGKRGP